MFEQSNLSGFADIVAVSRQTNIQLIHVTDVIDVSKTGNQIFADGHDSGTVFKQFETGAAQWFIELLQSLNERFALCKGNGTHRMFVR